MSVATKGAKRVGQLLTQTALGKLSSEPMIAALNQCADEVIRDRGTIFRSSYNSPASLGFENHEDQFRALAFLSKAAVEQMPELTVALLRIVSQFADTAAVPFVDKLFSLPKLDRSVYDAALGCLRDLGGTLGSYALARARFNPILARRVRDLAERALEEMHASDRTEELSLVPSLPSKTAVDNKTLPRAILHELRARSLKYEFAEEIHKHDFRVKYVGFTASFVEGLRQCRLDSILSDEAERLSRFKGELGHSNAEEVTETLFEMSADEYGRTAKKLGSSNALQIVRCNPSDLVFKIHDCVSDLAELETFQVELTWLKDRKGQLTPEEFRHALEANCQKTLVLHQRHFEKPSLVYINQAACLFKKFLSIMDRDCEAKLGSSISVYRQHVTARIAAFEETGWLTAVSHSNAA